jgi:hypothetical protein
MRIMLDVRQRLVDVKTTVARASGRLCRRGWHDAAIAVVVVIVTALMLPGSPSHAADGEIRIGNTMPYSGPGDRLWL